VSGDGRTHDEEPDATRTDHGKPPASVPSRPDAIGRYRILRKLGEGGTGTVYEAEQESPKREVAVNG